MNITTTVADKFADIVIFHWEIKKKSLINVKQKQRFECFHLNSSGLLPSSSTLAFTLFIENFHDRYSGPKMAARGPHTGAPNPIFVRRTSKR